MVVRRAPRTAELPVALAGPARHAVGRPADGGSVPRRGSVRARQAHRRARPEAAGEAPEAKGYSEHGPGATVQDCREEAEEMRNEEE